MGYGAKPRKDVILKSLWVLFRIRLIPGELAVFQNGKRWEDSLETQDKEAQLATRV
jgi:hypothetical protein